MKLFPKKTRKFLGRALWWCALFAVCFLSAVYAFPYLRSRGASDATDIAGGAGGSAAGENKPIVLSLWHADTFEGGKASRAAFLKRAAAEYGKKNGGVIVLVSSYTTAGLKAAFEKGETPDLVSFGIGAEVNPGRFAPLSAEFTKGLKIGAGAGVSGAGKAALAVPWCMNCYALYTEKGDFSNASAENVLVSSGGNNLAEAAFSFAFAGEKLQGGAKESVAAYAAFLSGEKKFLLATGRDLYRFAARERRVKAKFLPGYNDLYQQIGVISARSGEKKAAAGAAFISYLLSETVQKKLPQIGMFSAYYKVYGEGGTGDGAIEAADDIAGTIAADLENELFASGGARLYADAFLSETARKSAAELAVNGQTAEVRQYCKSK